MFRFSFGKNSNIFIFTISRKINNWFTQIIWWIDITRVCNFRINRFTNCFIFKCLSFFNALYNLTSSPSDGDPVDGLETIGQGNDPLTKVIGQGAQAAIELSA
jgi:hypothetical protein